MPAPSTQLATSPPFIASSLTHISKCGLTKVLFVMVDGLGDVSIPELNGMTPLESAKTPILDQLMRANSSLRGLMHPVEPGVSCGSDTAHLNILGYPPQQYYRSRGAYETVGAGLPMEPGDIAFKGSFAYGEFRHLTKSIPLTNCHDENGDSDSVVFIVKKRRCDPLFHEWGVPLCDGLTALSIPNFPEVNIAVKHATEHRCGFRIRSPYTLSDNIDSMDPLKDNLPLLRAEARTLLPNQMGTNISDKNQTETLTPISRDGLTRFQSKVSLSSLKKNSDNGTKYGLVSVADLRQKLEQNDKSAFDLTSADELLQRYLKANGITPKEYDDRLAKYTADVVNAVSETCQKYLETHPIILERKRKNLPTTNLVLLRACGKLTQVPPFPKRLLRDCSFTLNLLNTKDTEHFACKDECLFRFGSIAPTAIISGLTQSLGFEVIPPPSGATGLVHSDISGKFKTALECLFPTSKTKSTPAQPQSLDCPFSFVFLHVKGADEASHDGNYLEKKLVIECVDASLGSFLQTLRLSIRQGNITDRAVLSSDLEKAVLSPFTDSFIVVVTGDHSTPCYSKDHGPDPVPFLITLVTPRLLSMMEFSSEGFRGEEVSTAETFGERTCARGELGQFTGADVLSIIHILQEEALKVENYKDEHLLCN